MPDPWRPWRSSIPGNDLTDAEARAERRSRSLEEPMGVTWLEREPYPVLEVRNPLHHTSYRVFLPEFPSSATGLCTCPDFSRRGLGTCKHLEAALRHIRMHPTGRLMDSKEAAIPPARQLWEAIDRAPLRAEELSTLHESGRALWDWGSPLKAPQEPGEQN